MNIFFLSLSFVRIDPQASFTSSGIAIVSPKEIINNEFILTEKY